MAENVSVAEAIRQLREQLERAQAEAGGPGLRFRAKSVEVEMSVVFKTELEAGVGVKAWFLDLSGKAKAGEEAAHKVRLVLEPVMVPPAGATPGRVVLTDVLVSDADRERDQPG